VVYLDVGIAIALTMDIDNIADAGTSTEGAHLEREAERDIVKWCGLGGNTGDLPHVLRRELLPLPPHTV
jgi:hypothetical protein